MIVHKMKAQKGSDSTMLLDTCKKSNMIGGWGNEELNPVKRVKSNFISHCDSKVEILMLSNSLLLSKFAFLFGGKHLKTDVKPTTHTHTHTHTHTQRIVRYGL